MGGCHKLKHFANANLHTSKLRAVVVIRAINDNELIISHFPLKFLLVNINKIMPSKNKNEEQD